VKTLFMPDTLGNVIETRNMDTGAQTSSTTYWPYGEVRTQTGTNPSPFGFCGVWGYYTQAGQPTYVRARYYRPNLGRWQTVDPLWPNETAYIYLSPTFAIDYLGLSRIDLGRALGDTFDTIRDDAKRLGEKWREFFPRYGGNEELGLNLELGWQLRCGNCLKKLTDGMVAEGKAGTSLVFPSNSLRHCTWACKYAKLCPNCPVSLLNAKEYIDTLEHWPKRGPGTLLDSKADKWNNSIGFKLGGCNPEQCQDACFKAYVLGFLDRDQELH
jgi:RHS repeat-associated protein